MVIFGATAQVLSNFTPGAGFAGFREARNSLIQAFKATRIPFPWDIDIKVTEKLVGRAIVKYLNAVTRNIISAILNDTIRKQAMLKRLVTEGGHPGFPVAGILWGSIFDRLSDRRITAEMGFPDNFNRIAAINRALRQSIDITVHRMGKREAQVSFAVNYQRLRSKTPHPGKRTATGHNISVKSWLDWLTGDEIVTDAGFATLRELGASPSRRPKSPRAQSPGADMGWMINNTKDRVADGFKFPKLKRNSQLQKKSGSAKKRRNKISVPTRWRISRPLPKEWLTERSLQIGLMMLSVYEDKIVKRALRHALDNTQGVLTFTE